MKTILQVAHHHTTIPISSFADPTNLISSRRKIPPETSTLTQFSKYFNQTASAIENHLRDRKPLQVAFHNLSVSPLIIAKAESGGKKSLSQDGDNQDFKTFTW